MGDDAPDVGKVQSFFNNLGNAAIQAEPLLTMFKKLELESTMAAASTGKYYEYWTVDRISDLNNLVDADPGCDPVLKNIFNKGSKNPRLKGNKIGQAIYNRMVALMSDPSQLPAAAAAPPPAAETPPAASMGAPPAEASRGAPPAAAAGGGGAAPAGTTRYIFSSELPAGTQLRVRASPSVEGEIMGLVTAEDDIVAKGTFGDWLCVLLAEDQEAWMMHRAGDTQLLIPADEAGRFSASAQQPGPVAAAPEPVQYQAPPQQPDPQPYYPPSPPRQQQQPQQIIQQAPPPQPVPQLNTSVSQFDPYATTNSQQGQTLLLTAGPAPQGAVYLSQTLPPSTPRAGPIGLGSEYVSRAHYENLERRVATLETELFTLKQLLRSI